MFRICFAPIYRWGCDKYGPCEQYFSNCKRRGFARVRTSNLSPRKYGVIVASVNFRCWSSRTGVFLALWLCVIVSAQAQNKVIRLRNEQITTAPPNREKSIRAAQQPSLPVSGLYLIQFSGRFDPAWKEDLRGRRVDLLRYIPDDAYVARLVNVSLDELRALPFVQWVGEYRPEHKLHGVLSAFSQGRQNVANTPEVSVLFSPTATPAELAEARARLGKIQQQSHSRFGAVMRGKVTSVQLQRLAESPAVLWIEPAPKMKLTDEISSKLVAGEGTGHKTFMQDLGFDGRGVTVAVADSGLHVGTSEGMHPDLAGRTPAFFFYGALSNASDEHAHGTHVAGIIAGNATTEAADDLGYYYGLGVAPGASIVTQRLFDGEGGYEPPPSFETLTRDAVQAGAEIGSNSWGDDTQGRYDISAAEFDALVRDADGITPGDQPYILEFSAGNAGPGLQTIGSPAVAKNVIATGASQNDRFDFFVYADGSETMADFSSRGPCEDGRIKPDVVAPGTWIASLRSPVANDENAWLDIDSDYLYMGGTSQAGPQVSGAAAVFVQYYRETYPDLGTPSPAVVKAALIHSAVDMDDSFETGPTPNMDEGWGRVDLTQIIYSPRAHDYLDQTVLLTTGNLYERSVIISDDSEPLSITLVYTDVPGFPAAIPALVNDLDLEVVGPDGRVYRGNQFEQGESVPDASASDSINNVEGIRLEIPSPGEYILRVRARNVVQDARRDTPAIDQDFALVISGNIPPLETGIVLLDRSRYTAPGRMRIKFFDVDLAGEPSATVTVRSATEPNGQLLTLLPINPTGVFTGSVATATGPAIAGNNKLEISHGDWIRVEYVDQSDGSTNVANALADLLPPVISNVSVTNQFGQTIVSWLTDEPANSVVRFNTNSALGRAVTNNFRTTFHRQELSGLVVGQTYFYVVVSTDAAGNSSTNSNGGALFSFVVPAAATVLLVDAYVPTVNDKSLIPLSTYTDPLNEIGVSYDVWNTEDLGMPAYVDLSPYRVVMWRINDSFWADDTIPSAQQTAIQQYLNNGGTFFMASMDILTRLLDSGGASFVTNVLHVRRFDRADPLCFCHCDNCDEDTQVPSASGVPSDVVGDGFLATLDYSAYPDDFVEFGLGPDFSDTFGVATNAAPILIEEISQKAAGLRYPRTGEDSPGRVVFVSFPLDAIPEFGPEPSSRTAFVRRALQFLYPGLNGVGTVALNQDSYRLPDLITIEVGDSDLAELASSTVQVHSSSFSNRVAVTVAPTSKPGLLRGSVPVVSGTNAPAPGRFRANNGDTVVVEYFDASGQVTIHSTAVIDVVSPAISNLEVLAEYQDAVVIWDTSELSDSLVQYGESAFLGKTAYMDEPAVNHEVQLRGLIPDRLYFYKIVSRDAAGNVVEDDNSGELHTFRTLRPLTPPFVDRMQDGGTNWSVFDGDETQFQWRIGSPQNGQVANTPSGDAKAWASNLQGDPADLIDTFLISPAINLTGGNVARLRFWNAYDFGYDANWDIINGGELLIVTNAVSAPTSLAEYYESNGGWEEEEIDLTPYMGSVVFLIWHHQLLSFESAERPGWAIDDVSVVVTNIPPGTIQVTNNLAQARMTLSGPVSRTVQGYGTSIADLPPGNYVATWNPVPYYMTPVAQTNVLEADGLLSLFGEYLFPDANQNGMSDTWEQQYFGVISPTRTCLTDTDSDGFPDCAEFAAGTNPVLANSYLRLNQPVLQAAVNKLRFQWQSSPGRIYQVQGSVDGINWVGVSTEVLASTSTTSALVSVPDPSEPFIFRLQVRP